MSLLQFVAAVDSFPYADKNPNYYEFFSHENLRLGFVIPEVVAAIRKTSVANCFEYDDANQQFAVAKHLDTFDARTKMIGQLAEELRLADKEVAHGWRNELYTVYSPLSQPYFLVERAISGMLGVVTYGVHINGYVPAEKTVDGKMRMWIPRRSATKQTYPGKLDNTIAGGLAYPLGIWKNVVKESYEEAGLDEEFVKARTKPAGVVLYLCQPFGPKGHAQPEVEYIYDMEFDGEGGIRPTPVDGEAEDFALMTLDEIYSRIKGGEFKPNCVLVIIDFLIRHGFITPDEPDYFQIVTRIHRHVPFATLN